MASTNDNEAAYQLLGWSTNNSMNSNSTNIENTEVWKSLHSSIRTQPDGTTKFQNAMKLLSTEGITFQSNNVSGQEEGSGNRDALSIIKSYFRLIKCSLESPTQMQARSTNAESKSNDSDQWSKLASELLKRMTESLKVAIQHELSPSSTSTNIITSTAATNNSTSLPPQSSNNNSQQLLSQTIQYYLTQIQTTVHPHISKHIRLLGPTYRSLNELSDLYIQTLTQEKCNLDRCVDVILSTVGYKGLLVTSIGNNKDGSSVQTDLHQLNKTWKQTNTLLYSASFSLLGLLDNIVNVIQSSLFTFINESTNRNKKSLSGGGGGSAMKKNTMSPDKQVKIVIFILARITSLILLDMRYDESFHMNDMNKASIAGGAKGGRELQEVGEESGKSRKALFTAFIQRLVRVYHLSLMAKHQQEQQSSLQHKQQQGGDKKPLLLLLDSISSLHPKVEQYLSKILLLDTNLSDSSNKNIGGGSVVCLGLDCFVNLPSSSSCTSSSNEDCDVMEDTALAKLLLMKYVLKKLVAIQGDNSELSLLLPNPHSLIDYYQSLLFVDVPKCHHFFDRGSLDGGSASSSGGKDLSSHRTREILSDLVCLLEQASHMLCRRSGGMKKGSSGDDWQSIITQQHHLLIRWLAAPAASTQLDKTSTLSAVSSKNHPMANELLLHILHRRVLSSCSANDTYSRQDATHLITLLTQLLFHQRTETFHRQNIATLLVRLLSVPKRTKKQTDATSLTINSLWSTMKKANVIGSSNNDTQRKRKRSKVLAARSLSSTLTPDNVNTICTVLESLARSTVLSRTSIPSEVSLEIKQLWEEDILSSTTKNGKRFFSRSEDIDRAMFIISLSTGAIRVSQNLDNFFSAFGCNAGGASTTTTDDKVISILDFIELQFGGGGKKSSVTASASGHNATRKVMMKANCIRLVSALSKCIANDLSESQFNRMGSILKNATVSASSTSNESVQTLGLRYSAVSAASKMSSIVRSDFDEGSLKVCICTSLFILTHCHICDALPQLPPLIS